MASPTVEFLLKRVDSIEAYAKALETYVYEIEAALRKVHQLTGGQFPRVADARAACQQARTAVDDSH